MNYSAGDEKHAEELGYHRSNWWQIRKLERQGYTFIPNPYNKEFPWIPVPKGASLTPLFKAKRSSKKAQK